MNGRGETDQHAKRHERDRHCWIEHGQRLGRQDVEAERSQSGTHQKEQHAVRQSPHYFSSAVTACVPPRTNATSTASPAAARSTAPVTAAGEGALAFLPA